MKSFRWGILGCGSIAESFAKGIKTLLDGSIDMCASRTPGRARNFAQQYKIPNHTESYQELVENPHLDAVYVATTHNFHFENALLALNHDKAVLVEKAFTLNAGQAKILISTARARKLFLMEAMWTRFLPAVEFLREQLTQAVIGDIRLIRADFGIKPQMTPEHRILNPLLGGGAMLDLGVYPISFSQMIFGEKPSAMYSAAITGETGVDEQSVYTLTYSGGRTAMLSSSARMSMPHDAWLFGTEGYIHIPDFFHPSGFHIKPDTGSIRKIRRPYTSTGLNYETAEVHRCLAAGELESPVMPLDETLQIMEIMDEIRADWGLEYPGEYDYDLMRFEK